MMPGFAFVAMPGTRLLVYTQVAGTTAEYERRESEAEQRQPPLPVAGWVCRGPDEFYPLVPWRGTLVAFRVESSQSNDPEREAQHRRELAERFGWLGQEVVRAETFIPENVTAGISGQVHVRQAEGPQT